MIRIAEPFLGAREAEYAKRAVESGWISGGGPFVERFEHAIAQACGRRWAVATVTGTAALHLALTAVGVGPKATVRMPSLTFAAAANAVLYLGAKPTFVDRETGWTPDSTLLSPDRGSAICDAAPAIGDPEACKPGWLAILSFNGNKTVTTGQGGAVLGDDSDLRDRVRHLAQTAKTGHYRHDAVGFNYTMPNLNAAVGCAQMERIEELKAAKQAILDRYREAGFELLRSGWIAVMVTERRMRVIEAFLARGIEAKPFYMPLHVQEPYAGFRCGALPETQRLKDTMLCLPCSADLSERDQREVIDCVKSCA